MKKQLVLVFIIICQFGCNTKSKVDELPKTGSFKGVFTIGNYTDNIQFEIEEDSTNLYVFFTSLEQNASRIPFQNVDVIGDSINFKLQSDFYTYSFKNKWVDNYTKLDGILSVDTMAVAYSLEKETLKTSHAEISKEVSFNSNGLAINGTIWYPENDSAKAMVIVSSSGNADRSASRAEAKLLAQKGFTIFHYDKRGTGASEGDWVKASMEELLSDDLNAITFFSSETGIPISNIGIKGSSQGGTKVPYILNELKDLKFGVVVSCPGTTLLESDLNYWINRSLSDVVIGKEEAIDLQRKVFEHIAGTLSRNELETLIEAEKSKPWFNVIWVPNLDEIDTDTKLLYSPITYFEKIKQPILIIQGSMDEIIPINSHEVIAKALNSGYHDNYQITLLDGATHSMNFAGKSDFPYWSKVHPEYFKVMTHWIDRIAN